MTKRCIAVSVIAAAVLFSGCEHPARAELKNNETAQAETAYTATALQSSETENTASETTIATTEATTVTTTVAATVATTEATTVTTEATTAATTEATTAATTKATTVTTTEATTTAPEKPLNVPMVREPMTERWSGISLIPISDNGMEYVWSQLSDEVKDNVAVMMNAMRNMKSKFALKHPVKESEIWEFVHFVHDYLCGYTHVDYYDYTYWYDSDNYVTDLEFVYTVDSKEAKAMNEAVQNKVNELVASAPDTSEYDRIKYFHDYIVKNCTYSYEGKSVDTAYGALIEGKAICQGYAHAMQLLLSRAGFDAVPAMGDHEDGYHKWNYVRLSDGKWYVIDATWDDPTGESPDYIGYDYFLITDEQLEKDHSHRYGSRYFTVPTAE